MAAVQDIAAYILSKQGPLPAMKLQKLVYYSQAWSLVWDEAPLFSETIQAWAFGPVIPDLYRLHKSQFIITSLTGDPTSLTPTQQETIDKVLAFYGDKSSLWLSDLTHQEDPWLHARKGLKPGERSSQEITHTAMAEYYDSLY
jgi:uncharacterized phage-associated protein